MFAASSRLQGDFDRWFCRFSYFIAVKGVDRELDFFDFHVGTSRREQGRERET